MCVHIVYVCVSMKEEWLCTHSLPLLQTPMRLSRSGWGGMRESVAMSAFRQGMWLLASSAGTRQEGREREELIINNY